MLFNIPYYPVLVRNAVTFCKQTRPATRETQGRFLPPGKMCWTWFRKFGSLSGNFSSPRSVLNWLRAWCRRYFSLTFFASRAKYPDPWRWYPQWDASRRRGPRPEWPGLSRSAEPGRESCASVSGASSSGAPALPGPGPALAPREYGAFRLWKVQTENDNLYLISANTIKRRRTFDPLFDPGHAFTQSERM